jgi:hypothetical protein
MSMVATVQLVLVATIAMMNASSSECGSPDAGDPPSETHVLGDARGELSLTGWSIADYWCKPTTNCPAGAVYVATTGGGQNVKGCSLVGGVCAGTCLYCSGGGVADVCMSRGGDTCIYTT